MSLATRCTACNTVFKVVQDQLKVSKGWVRCGRCDTVFNALEELFELNGDTVIGIAQRSSLVSTAPEPVATPQALAQEPFEEDDLSGLEIDKQEEPPHSLFAISRSGIAKTPAALVQPRDRNEFADAQFDSDLLVSEDAPGVGPQPEQVAQAGEEMPYTPPLPGDETPAFIRHADAQARWKTPRARLSLILCSLLLVGLLGMQVTYHFRDLWAAQIPASRGFLTAWCNWTGCKVMPYRSIKDFTVENTALTRLPGNNDVFRLSVTLRNRSTLSLRLPWVELSVSDSAGQLMARRTLVTSDFQVPQDSLKGHSEITLQLLLKSLNPSINGYTVEVFYP
jgi:predicted Zn finger-like uncharacterized protein